MPPGILRLRTYSTQQWFGQAYAKPDAPPVPSKGGCETASIATTTPALFSVFSLVVLMANRMIRDGKVPIQCYPWYQKSEATFSDVIAMVRRDIWQSRYCEDSGLRGESPIFRSHFLQTLIETVCYAG